MRLAAYALSVFHAIKLLDSGASIIIAGSKRFGLRLSYDASLSDLRQIKEHCEKQGAMLYVPFTTFIHPNEIEEAKKYFNDLIFIGVDGIYFSDLAIYTIAKQMNKENILLYHPETLTTNFYEALFWEKQNIKGMVIAREVTTLDAIKIGQKSNFEIQLLAHGYLTMFHSRRNLLSTYFNATNISQSLYEYYYLVEEKRDDAYRIIEDKHGTHIFRALPMQSFNRLSLIKDDIDALIINSNFLTESEIVDAVVDYQQVLNNKGISNILDKYRGYDEGFHNKKTIYRKEKVSK